jgi:two-component system, cell cycle sensor histidine kinase and response regulator CckA
METKSRSLLNEIQLLTVLVSMAIVVVVVGASLFILSHTMLVNLRTRSIATADEMAAFLEYPLYAVDDDQAVRIAETYLSSGKISGIVLESAARGILLSETHAKESLRVPPISRSITRDGILLGKITLTFSDAEVTLTQARLAVIAMVIVVAVLLANITANRLLIVRRVRRTLDAIFAAIRNFSEGNYETSIGFTPYRDVNVLVFLLNDMAGKIRQKNLEQKKIKEALLAERQYLMDIIDLLPDATFIVNTDRRIVAWNRAAEAMTEMKKDEMLGRGDYEYAVPFFGERRPMLIDLLDTPDAEMEKFYKYIQRSGTTIYGEAFLQNLNAGRGAHLWAVAAPLYDRNGTRTGAIELIRDITDYKRADEDKLQLQVQLLQAQKMESVGRLAGGMAHDFNNMLSAILGHAELAMMDFAQSEAIHPHLKAIKETALRSAALIRQLLAFARKQTVAPKVLDLNDSVAGMLKMLRRLIGEDIDLVWKPGADLGPVKIDPSQLDQILANLCVNARDAITGVGKVEIETANITFDEAYCALHPGFVCGDYVMLAVRDDGCGMSQNVQDRIFEPFFTTKETGKGTGLGLATVYGTVKQNDGFINVHSEPGKGSTFEIYLPRVPGEAVERITASAPAILKGCGETVLLVEDEAAVLSVGRAMLEELGYRVLTAGTPSQALRHAQAHAAEIQLLLTDVVMPEMNGRELAQSISDIIPGLKYLFTSGYTADVIAHRGMLYEGVHFLQKPFSTRDLAIKVRQALGKA